MHSRIVALLLATALLLAGCAAARSGELGTATTALDTPVATRGAQAARPFLTIAHRGASGSAPEHTIASYDLALELGADYIEQDLQQTSDGVLVALHDETLDRTGRGSAENCTGLVRTKTLAQLKTCDVGSWFNDTYPRYARPEYAGLRIPTLEEVFQRYGDRANYYIETKSPERADRMEERLVALLDRYGLRAPSIVRRQVLIQSFSPASLRRVHALDPALPLVQLFYGEETSWTIQAGLAQVADYAVGIGPSKDAVDAALIAAARTRCLDLHPYTVNERPEMQRLIALGVDGMFTNFPRELNEIAGRASGTAANPARAATTPAACQPRR